MNVNRESLYHFSRLVTNHVRANALLDGIVYTKGDATQAGIIVKSMNDAYNRLPSDKKTQYKATVEAINAAWKKYDDALVFYEYRDAVRIGEQAQIVIRSISETLKDAPSFLTQQKLGGENPLKPLGDTLNSVLKLAVVGGAAFLGYKIYSESKRGER